MFSNKRDILKAMNIAPSILNLNIFKDREKIYNTEVHFNYRAWVWLYPMPVLPCGWKHLIFEAQPEPQGGLI